MFLHGVGTAAATSFDPLEGTKGLTRMEEGEEGLFTLFTLKPQHRSSLIEETDIARLIETMSAFQPPDLGKWMERMKSDERWPGADLT